MAQKILVTRHWPEAVEDLLERRFGATINREDRVMPPAELSAALGAYDAVLSCVADKFPADIYPADVRTRFLGNFGVGYDNIDVAAAKERGIMVSNTPDVLTDCTADLAMTLIMATARRAGEGERIVRAGRWQGWSLVDRLGTRVTGKTLGIVGMGRIGKATARRAHYGFDMRIVFYNRSLVSDPRLDAMAARQLASVEDVIAESDFVSLHCPGGAANRHLINADRLKCFRKTGILINTARGEVVDEMALIAALQAGTLAGAGLDVFEREPHVPEALLGMENVVLLPHLGSATQETRIAMGMKVVENLTAFLEGRPLPDRVA